MPEMKSHKVTMLGTGLIGMFYTMTLHNQRGADRVHSVYSRREERATEFAEEWNIPHATTDLAEAINHPETDTVVIGLPNNLHLKTVELAAEAGKSILCTKPLGRTAEEAKAMLDIVESAGVFGGYLEDLGLSAKDPQSVRVRPKRGTRQNSVGAFPRDASRSAQRLVLGSGTSRRRCHR